MGSQARTAPYRRVVLATCCPPPQQLFVSADQKTVAGVNGSTVAFYDAASGHQLRTVTLPVPADGTLPGVRQLAMSPSLNLAGYIDARESDGRVHVFRLSDQHDQTIHGPVPASADYPSGGSVAFAGDDTLLVMGQTGTLEAWDLHTFKRRWGLSTPIPRGVVRGSEDGRWAVVRYQDAVLRLYDVESGELVAPVPTPGPDDGRTGYAFSGDSHYLAIAVEGGIVHRISVQPQDWVRAACTAAGGTLTAEDRQRLTGATQLGPDPCSR